MKTIQIDLDGPDGYKFHLIKCAREFAQQLNQDIEELTKLLTNVSYKELLKIFKERFGNLVTFVASQRKYGILVRAKQFNDNTLMPWGKYINWPMRSVPIEYFKWLSMQPWMKYWPAMRDYINFERGVWNGEDIWDDVPSTVTKSDKVINSLEEGAGGFTVGKMGVISIIQYSSERNGTWYHVYYNHGEKYWHIRSNTVTKINGEKPQRS